MTARLVRRASVVVVFALTSLMLARAQSETVYVTRTGQKYHLDGCRSLSRSKIPMALTEAAKRYGPCSVCRPPVPTATPALSGKTETTQPSVALADSSSLASMPVLITRTGSKYHRAGCRTLRAGGIPTTLSEASKKYGPCAVCRPPPLGLAR